RMSFLTAASDRSSSGSGVSGVSGVSFSGASSFSFSFCAALVLLAIPSLLGTPILGADPSLEHNHPYPMQGESNGPIGAASRPRRRPDSDQLKCHRGGLNPD